MISVFFVLISSGKLHYSATAKVGDPWFCLYYVVDWKKYYEWRRREERSQNWDPNLSSLRMKIALALVGTSLARARDTIFVGSTNSTSSLLRWWGCVFSSCTRFCVVIRHSVVTYEYYVKLLGSVIWNGVEARWRPDNTQDSVAIIWRSLTPAWLLATAWFGGKRRAFIWPKPGHDVGR